MNTVESTCKFGLNNVQRTLQIYTRTDSNKSNCSSSERTYPLVSKINSITFRVIQNSFTKRVK